jgi:diadenosine tetraphosphatase ApaH/serine/threonine PP2A family protein phosphatase
MPLALMTDIHGNREAFSACLEHAARCGVDRYVFLGDYVGYGADPGWVVDQVMRLVERGAVALMGNHDAAVLLDDSSMNPTAQEAIEWTKAQLDDSQRKFLGALPLTAEESGRLFVHANAAAPESWGYILGPSDARRSLLATRCRQTFCGHVHVPALYYLGPAGNLAEFTPVAGVGIPLLRRRRWLAVIGAVGQPRDHNAAACYALLDDERDMLSYARVPYDVATAARKVREAGLPAVLSLRLESGF